MWLYGQKPSFALGYKLCVLCGTVSLVVTLAIAGYLYIEGRLLPDRTFWLTLSFVLSVLGFGLATVSYSLALVVRFIWRQRLPQRRFYHSRIVTAINLILWSFALWVVNIIRTGQLPEWYVPL